MYPEPHIPTDHAARRLVFLAGLAFCTAFWAMVIIWAIGGATQRPAACEGLGAAECAAATAAGLAP